MYESLKNRTLPKQVEYLTTQLVKIPSVNGTEGEGTKADRIQQWIRSFPYFQEHPELVWEQKIPGNESWRKNIFAMVKGESASSKTILYHGHLDTVNVKDFGAIENIAFNPEELQAFFNDYSKDPVLQKEAQSGDWMFGRGALDMQSGDAVHLANLLYFSEHATEMGGNLLVMFNPGEESEHEGVITAISELKRLRDEEGLTFIGAVNDDFISPLYENDSTRYLYTGAAGKLLPSFYIYGREAHVGETLKGIDSTLVASEINSRINNNMDLVENIEGEVVMPPSCLYQRDGKETYNVQIPFKSHLYFNYFLYERGPRDVIDKLKPLAREACDAVEEKMKKNYKRYLEKAEEPEWQLSWHLEVTTLQEYIELLRARGINVDHVIEETCKDNEASELRDLSFKIVDSLQQLDHKKEPRVILFFSPPHCPHSYLNENHDQDREILEAMDQVVAEAETEDQFAVKKFFPFLSDSSYLSLHETDEELNSLIENFIPWNERYSIPVRDIRSLAIPAINMGVYGKDAHQWTERVYKPYSFETLPLLIRRLTEILLDDKVGIEQKAEALHV
ncbi:MAG TPA: peptidase M20 [Bacillales bacterium]